MLDLVLVSDSFFSFFCCCVCLVNIGTQMFTIIVYIGVSIFLRFSIYFGASKYLGDGSGVFRCRCYITSNNPEDLGLKIRFVKVN